MLFLSKLNSVEWELAPTFSIIRVSCDGPAILSFIDFLFTPDKTSSIFPEFLITSSVDPLKILNIFLKIPPGTACTNWMNCMFIIKLN